MRREVRGGAAALALLFPVSGLLAARAPDKLAPAPAAAPSPISAALCGRGEKFRARLAKGLDEFGPIAVPPIWRDVKVENFQRWLEAPICPGASEQESKLYRTRRVALDRLGRRLERAEVTEEIGSLLARFRGWRPSAVEWPRSAECEGCAALRSSAARVADIASRWPPRISTTVADRLAEAAKREPLIAELCAAKPLPGARAEIERRFRYYSWTASGARLLEVAAFFGQPEVVAECRSR